MQCHSIVVDKVELLQALDFGDDLKQLKYESAFRCIFTTTDTRGDTQKQPEEIKEFKAIKQHFMGTEQALIIKLNHDVNQKASLFERIGHLYAMCETNLDKFILLFSFIKLAIV